MSTWQPPAQPPSWRPAAEADVADAPLPAEPDGEVVGVPRVVADAWWSTPATDRAAGESELDLDAEPPLPTMVQLDQLSAELDEIDAALALMDAEGPLARPAAANPNR